MNKQNPLMFLVVVVILGIAIEAVEQADKKAAYVLAGTLLLGYLTFNARMFNQQLDLFFKVVSNPQIKYGPGDNSQNPGTQPVSVPRKKPY